MMANCLTRLPCRALRPRPSRTLHGHEANDDAIDVQLFGLIVNDGSAGFTYGIIPRAS
jgi:hypothetical protein